MSLGALKLVALIWNYPLIFCLFLLLFTPALFPIVLYFSPLFISTGLCAIALVSMNMADSSSSSSESKDDPYLRRWQSEQLESTKPQENEKHKQQQQSWSQWMTNMEEKTRLWIDHKLTPQQRKRAASPRDGNSGFRWKVIHDNDDENDDDRHILPPATKPTKIKFGTRTVDHEGDHQQQEEENVESASSITEGEEEIRKANSNSNSGALHPQKEEPEREEIIAAASTFKSNKIHQDGVITNNLSCKSEEKPAPVVEVMIKRLEFSHYVDKSKPPSRPPPPSPSTSTRRFHHHHRQQTDGRRDVVSNSNENNSPMTGASTVGGVQAAAGRGVAAPVVVEFVTQQEDITTTASHAIAQQQQQQHAAAEMIFSQEPPKSDDGDSDTLKSVSSSAARSIVSHTTTTTAPTDSLQPGGGSYSNNSNHVRGDAVVEPSAAEENSKKGSQSELEGELPRVSRPSLPSGTPTAFRGFSMKEKVAEARMRKPEPTTGDSDAGGLERDEQFAPPRGTKLGTREDRDSELGVASSDDGEVHDDSGGIRRGLKKLGRSTASHTNTSRSESTTFQASNANPTAAAAAVDSFDESEIADRSAGIEKVIFVDESSNYTFYSDQQRFSNSTAEGVCLRTNAAAVEDEKKSSVNDEVYMESFSVSPSKLEGETTSKVDFLSSSPMMFSDTISDTILPNQSCKERTSSFKVEIGTDVHTSAVSIEKKQHNANLAISDSVDAEISSKVIEGEEAETLCSFETTEGGDSVVEGLDCAEKPKAGNEESEAVAASENAEQNSNEEGDGERASIQEDGADIEDSTDDKTRSSTLLKKSSSMPAASSRYVRKSSKLVKANSFAEKNLHQNDSDSNSNSDSDAVRGNSRTKKIHNLDSVEEITARLSMKYNPTWAKVQQQQQQQTQPQTKEVAEPSGSTSLALTTLDTPTDEAPEISPVTSAKESPPKGSDEPFGSYMVSMKKVLSAVRNARNRDKEGAAAAKSAAAQAQIPEKKGLSSVLSIKRERFTSPLRRAALASSTSVKKKEKQKENPVVFTVLAEDEKEEEEEKVSVDKFKDRLMMMPLVKAFSSEAKGGSGSSSGKKTDTAGDLTTRPTHGASSSSPPALAAVSSSSPGHKQTATGTEAVADGKSRGRFMLPLKKKRFSSDSKEERSRKNDSAGSEAAPQTPDRKEEAEAVVAIEDKKIKSPGDKKFSLYNWSNKKRQKDAVSPPAAAQQERKVSPSSIFENPRSPGISEETTVRLIPHGKSNSCTPSSPSPMMDQNNNDDDDLRAPSCLNDEFRSQERNLFSPLAKQQRDKKEKEKETAAAEELSKEKERATGGKTSSSFSSSWWTRKRDKVVVEEATIAAQEDDQSTREYARLFPQRRGGDDFRVSQEKMTTTTTSSSSSFNVAVGNSNSVDRNSTPSTSGSKSQYPLSVRSRINRESATQIKSRGGGHERRMSLPEFDTPAKGDLTLTSAEEEIIDVPLSVGRSSSGSYAGKKNAGGWKPQHLRHRSSDVIDMYTRRRRSEETQQQQQEEEELSPFLDGSRSNLKVKELYRNLDLQSPRSNVEIRITDKLKVPLEEILSLLAVGDSSSSLRNSTVTPPEESSSSSGEETSSSEEEWSSSDDEQSHEKSSGAPASSSVEELLTPTERAKKSWALHHTFYEENRQSPFVDD